MKKSTLNLSKVHIFLFLIVISGLGISADASELKISLQALQEKQLSGDGLLVLDVRSAEEFNEGRVPGAVNIPHTETDEIYQLLSGIEGKQLVVYCRTGRRVGLVLDAMKAKGLKGLYHLEGDMRGWTAAGLPIEK